MKKTKIFNIWDKIKTSHTEFIIHSIEERWWEFYYDNVPQSDILHIVKQKNLWTKKKKKY